MCLVAILLLPGFIALANDDVASVDSCASYKLLGNHIYDFGDIDMKDGPVSATFLVLSVGQNPMIITKSSTSCICTQVAYSQDVVFPGDTLKVEVTYDPFVAGTFKQSALISTNTHPYNYFRVYVKGNVVEGVEEKTKGGD